MLHTSILIFWLIQHKISGFHKDELKQWNCGVVGKATDCSTCISYMHWFPSSLFTVWKKQRRWSKYLLPATHVGDPNEGLPIAAIWVINQQLQHLSPSPHLSVILTFENK